MRSMDLSLIKSILISNVPSNLNRADSIEAYTTSEKELASYRVDANAIPIYSKFKFEFLKMKITFGVLFW